MISHLVVGSSFFTESPSCHRTVSIGNEDASIPVPHLHICFLHLHVGGTLGRHFHFLVFIMTLMSQNLLIF